MAGDINISKKISRIEVSIIITLIIVWISTGIIISKSKKDYLSGIVQLQSRVLNLAKDYLGTGLKHNCEEIVLESLRKSWPFGDHFSLFVISGRSFVLTTLVTTRHSSPKASELTQGILDIILKKTHEEKNGEAWIGQDKNSGFLATWSEVRGSGKGLVIGIVSSEDNLLRLSGYYRYRFMLMVCATILSVLILFLLVWSLSWIRITYLYNKSLMEKGA
ncbi:MAG TPA: hypothetical protein ENG28_03325 [Deltaproteobacteria bacterium]|nr:hypothetical protein [Deltaproteobacteria bacterium]